MGANNLPSPLMGEGAGGGERDGVAANSTVSLREGKERKSRRGRGQKNRWDMRYALVPVKDLPQAKARLSPLLSPAERHALAAAMLDDVLEALRHVSTLDRIALVTTDAYALALAARWGF